MKKNSSASKAAVSKQAFLEKLFPASIVLAGVLVYANSFAGVFLFDDRGHIIPAVLGSGQVRHDWLSHNAFTALRPLIQLSFRINFLLGGLNPFGYHAANLTIHILAALVLFGLVRRTLESRGKTRLAPTNASQNSHTALAFAIACLWVVHPLNAQAVTYIIQRSESLAGLFYLFAIYAVSRCVDSRSWKLAAVFSCALGMLTKETVVTAPVLALFYDRIFLSDSWEEIFKQRKNLYLGLFATWLLLIGTLVQQDPSRIARSAGFGFGLTTPLEYALTQPGVILHYIRLAFWPHPLVIDYDWPVARSAGNIWPPVLGIAFLVFSTFFALLKRPAIGFLGLWFFLILVPTSSIMPIKDIAFEHRMYLSLAAVAALTVIGSAEILERLKIRGFLTDQSKNLIGTALLGAAILVLGTLTIRRNQAYANEAGLWRETVASRPGNIRARNNLGVALQAEGKLKEAENTYLETLKINPSYEDARFNLGTVLDQQGKLEAAAAQYEEILRANPAHSAAHVNLGTVYGTLGKLLEAKAHYLEAIELRPEFAEVYYNLGNIAFQQGEYAEAVSHYESAIKFKPDYEQARKNLSIALRKQEALKRSRPQAAES